MLRDHGHGASRSVYFPAEGDLGWISISVKTVVIARIMLLEGVTISAELR